VAEVVDIVDKPAGRIVHLRILPGLLEDYQRLSSERLYRPDRVPGQAAGVT
jgi:hypothetical protein